MISLELENLADNLIIVFVELSFYFLGVYSKRVF